MAEHPFGWLSLAPPLVAIVMAISTRRVVISLLAGVFIGSLILTGGNPLSAVADLLTNQLWATFIDENKLYVASFTLLMGAMVGVMNRCGAMKGLVDRMSLLARGRRSGQLVGWLLGLLVFFDDYANTILLGGSLRPLAERLKISREKLAYLVDSTAAPVAGLALVSTWVAGEIGFVQDGLDKLPTDVSYTAFDLFVSSIPYRFYVLWSLLLVPMIGLLGRDFGPMWKAEQAAIAGRPSPSSDPHEVFVSDDPTAPREGVTSHWINAAAPVLVTVGVIIAALYSSGRAGFPADAEPRLMDIFGEADAYSSLLWGALAGVLTAVVLTITQKLLSLEEMSQALARGAAIMLPALVILWLASALSSMTGNSPLPSDERAAEVETAQVVAVLQADRARDLPLAESISHLLDREIAPGNLAVGLSQAAVSSDAVLDASGDVRATAESLGALLAATGISQEAIAAKLSDDAIPTSTVSYPWRGYRLYTGDYLASLLSGALSAPWLPTLIFLLAATIAFATGTSWGTMGIVMPLAIPITYGALASEGPVDANNPILLASIGGVLAGAIFGDHCSPISDTTVLSSQSCGCNHIAHVWTQLPYALLAAGVAVVCGALPIGFGAPLWLVAPLGPVVMLAIVWLFGKRTELGDSGV